MMKFVKSGMIFLTFLATCGLPSVLVAGQVEEGKKIAFDRKKGNCLACHQIEGGQLAGTLGPPLSEMKDRFPEREVLRAQIWDSTQNNPNSMMPPFGKHRILSDQEIEKVVDYIQQL